MDQFIVEGGNPISGEITPTGNKNEALPVLAAAILTSEPIVLRNIPDILDIQSMLELLESLGMRISRLDAHTFFLHAQSITSDTPFFHQASLIRGSFLLAGPMLARYGSIHLPGPGGDTIGVRPVNNALTGIERFGNPNRIGRRGQLPHVHQRTERRRYLYGRGQRDGDREYDHGCGDGGGEYDHLQCCL